MKKLRFFFRITEPERWVCSKWSSYFLYYAESHNKWNIVSNVSQLYTLDVQPTVWQAYHWVGDILEGAAELKGAKTCISIITGLKKSVKLKKERNGIWYLQTQTRRDKWAFQLQNGSCLPGKAQAPGEKNCWSLYRIKNYFLFQDSINKRIIQFFRKKHFPFKGTLKFELQTLVTPFIIWSHYLHSCWYILNHRCLLVFSMTLFSRNDFNRKSIPPTSRWTLNWP